MDPPLPSNTQQRHQTSREPSTHPRDQGLRFACQGSGWSLRGGTIWFQTTRTVQLPCDDAGAALTTLGRRRKPSDAGPTTAHWVGDQVSRGAQVGRARLDRTATTRPILKSQRAAGGLLPRRRRSCAGAAPPTDATGSEEAKASTKRRFDASGDVGRPRRERIGPRRRGDFEIAESRWRPPASKPPSPRRQRTPPGE